MQRHSKNSSILTKKLGKLISKLRKDKGLSWTQCAYQFDIDKGNLNRIENGLVDCKFTTLWRISQSLNLKLSELIKILENNLGEDFTLEDF